MTQANLFSEPYIDICINKHKSSGPSNDANKKAAPNKARDREKILAYITGRETYSKEIVRALQMPLQTVSARLADLKAMGLIVNTEKRAEGCGCVRKV
jgi:uncharacterized membrane protein